MITITSTAIKKENAFTLTLTDEEHRQFEREINATIFRWLMIERDRRGIYAKNQGVYVESEKDLNSFDGDGNATFIKKWGEDQTEKENRK